MPQPQQEASSAAVVTVAISCSALIRSSEKRSAASLARLSSSSTLFLFGSKRRWLFPATAAEVVEAARQPSRYHTMDPALKELILLKEARGEVHFLKKPELDYSSGYPGPADPQAYGRVSAWLENRVLGPLRLDAAWWLAADTTSSFCFCPSARKVVANFGCGFHEYRELKELLAQSYGLERVRPLMGDEL